MTNDENIDDDFLYEQIKRYDDEVIESLPSDTDLKHIFSDRFNYKMDNLIKAEKKNTFFINFKYYSKTAIIYIILITALTFGVTITVYAYRIRISEVISTVFDEFTSIKISSENNANNDKIAPIEPLYIPDGYKIIERYGSDYDQTIIYGNSLGNEIIYSQMLLANAGILIDTENAKLESIIINNIEVNTVEKNGYAKIYWNDENYFYMFNGNVEKSILLDMAENILQKSS